MNGQWIESDKNLPEPGKVVLVVTQTEDHRQEFEFGFWDGHEWQLRRASNRFAKQPWYLQQLDRRSNMLARVTMKVTHWIDLPLIPNPMTIPSFAEVKTKRNGESYD
jgi:hypothetical protein